MKAAVLQDTQRLEVQEIPTPEPGPGQVLVRIKYSAICGSDVHRFQYGMANPGVVLGHEYIGAVAQSGAGVTRWKEGDRVVGGGGAPPGEVVATRATSGARYSARTAGFQMSSAGGLAEYILMDEWRPSPIPDNVPDELAVLTEPCSVAVHAVRGSRFSVGDDVVVLGAGPIGLLAQQVLQVGGARSVYVSEPAPARARAAEQLGATRVFNPGDEDLVSEIVQLTGGLGAHVAFDCAAASPTLQQALELVRRGGQVNLISMAWEPVPVLTVEWIGREVELKASYGSTPEDWQIVLDLMSRGKIDHRPMISEASFIGFDDIQQSFERLMTPDHQIQLVLSP